MKANAFVKARYKLCIDLLKRHQPPHNNQSVLDLGCGDGALTWMLLQSGYSASGIDTSELGIQLAKQEHQKRNSQCDFQCIHSTDLPDKSYDAIVCSDVIEHVPDVEALLHDIHRLLKNGGIAAVLSTPIRFTEFPLDKEHFVEWFLQNGELCSRGIRS